MSPIVSVVMPVYNGERFLQAAIQSILQQTFTQFEFIIVDDGSTDGTIDIVHSYNDTRICLLKNERNAGIIQTLNKGIQRASGKYICRMDADDIALPERLERQVQFLDDHPDVAVVGAQAIIIDPEGRELGPDRYPQSHSEIMRMMFRHNPFAHPAVMIRASALKDLGMYNPQFIHNEDYDLWLRLGTKYQLANVPDVLLQRRTHGGSITVTKQLELVKSRVRTLHHAIFSYYKNPLLAIHLVRPVAAYGYRWIKNLLTH